VPSGSYLVFSDGTNVIDGGQGEAAQDDYNDGGAEPYWPADERGVDHDLLRVGCSRRLREAMAAQPNVDNICSVVHGQQNRSGS